MVLLTTDRYCELLKELRDTQALVKELFEDSVGWAEDCGCGDSPVIEFGKRLADLRIPISDNAMDDLQRYIDLEYRIYAQQSMVWGEENATQYLEKAAEAEEILNYIRRHQ